MCRMVSGSLGNRMLLLKILVNVKKGASSDITFMDHFVQIVDNLSYTRQA
jgi:hypothetical protein